MLLSLYPVSCDKSNTPPQGGGVFDPRGRTRMMQVMPSRVNSVHKDLILKADKIQCPTGGEINALTITA